MTDLSADNFAPEPPPLLPADWSIISGQIGPDPEDFRVSEIPLYEFSGEGEHLLLHLRKRGLNTRDVVNEVARHSEVSARDIGYAGMKDRHAVTTQWLSVATAADPDTWAWSDAVELLEYTRHQNKLRTGHLRGNQFDIRLVNVDAVDTLFARVEALRTTGILNGFDAQRFGLDGKNLEHALRWAQRGGRISHFKKKLYASVLQAHVFNLVLRHRADANQLRVLHGDVLRLDGNHSVFVSDDPAVDEARRQDHDVHLTGPIFGPRSKQPEHEALTIERSALETLALNEEAMERIARSGPGTRRDLFLEVRDLSMSIESSNTVRVQFSLESGAYATNVLRHLLRRGWDEPLRSFHDVHDVPKRNE